MAPKQLTELSPLQDLLDSVISRLAALERQAGIVPSAPSVSRHLEAEGPSPADIHIEHPAVVAYDAYMESAVTPFAKTCNELAGMENTGQLITDAWLAIRTIVVLASRSKMPSGLLITELQSQMKPLTTALETLRKLRLDRKFDWHTKAIMELCETLSWVFIKPPPHLASTHCKEMASSCEFWCNKIRKEYKGKDEKHIQFCDGLKIVANDLVAYIIEHHKTGLTWNPSGVSLAEAIVTLQAEHESKQVELSSPKLPKQGLVIGGAGGMNTLMTELQKKQTSDGTSAATGLKRVTKDQQTWRKEFKGEKSAIVPAIPVKKAAETATQNQTKLSGVPLLEYQDRGHKWVIEHHTKESAASVGENGMLVVEITDPKQQVYIFSCEHVTVQLRGEKVKSVIMDSCSNVNLVFGSCLAACETVNCKKIQIQTTGFCPSFSIDKTAGCLIYLSQDSVETTSFVTSQSSEMNVSFPDGAEHKEVPIPEQFVHKISKGSLTSEVSDLYH